MKTMAYWVGLILVGLSYGKPSTLFVITVLITFGVLFLIVIFFAVSSARVRVYMICLIIGCQIIFYGLLEIQSGRWTGVILVLLGPVIPYLGYRSRERIEEMMKKRAEKDQRRE
jgi:glycerol-3-phosphate acyltransferase PlsY